MDEVKMLTVKVVVDKDTIPPPLRYNEIIETTGLYEDDTHNYIYVDENVEGIVVIRAGQIFGLNRDEITVGGYHLGTYTPVQGELTLKILKKGT
jgi:hypothetical protein